MTRTVKRRTTKPALVKDPKAVTAWCGWCLGPAGAVKEHEKCSGKRSTTLICLCTVCGYIPPPKEPKPDVD